MYVILYAYTHTHITIAGPARASAATRTRPGTRRSPSRGYHVVSSNACCIMIIISILSVRTNRINDSGLCCLLAGLCAYIVSRLRVCLVAWAVVLFRLCESLVIIVRSFVHRSPSRSCYYFYYYYYYLLIIIRVIVIVLVKVIVIATLVMSVLIIVIIAILLMMGIMETPVFIAVLHEIETILV